MNDLQRFLLWIPVALGVGIALYFNLNEEPRLWTGGFLVLLSFVFIKSFDYLPSKVSDRLNAFRWFSFLILSTAIGFGAATVRTYSLSTVMICTPLKNCTFSGVVEAVEEKPACKRVILNMVSGEPFQNLPRKVRLTLKPHDPLPDIGRTIQGIGDFFPFSEPVSLKGFDFRRDAFFKGIGATGRLKSWFYASYSLYDQDHMKKNRAFDGFFTTMSQVLKRIDLNLKIFRTKLTNFLKKSIGGEEGAIAAALVTGDRSGLSDEVKQDFIDAGLAHLLAISGLHLSLVAGLIFLGIRRILCFFPFIVERYHLKKIVAVLVIPLLSFYLLISGNGVPAQRAFIMTAIVMIGVLIDRPAISMRLVAIAATLILLVFPESLISPSFQLSFSAVLALIAAYEGGWSPLRQWSVEGGRIRRLIVYCFGLVATTVIATLATTPFTIYIFNQFTLQSLMGNLIAIPLTSLFIMPFLFFGALSFLWGGSAVIFDGTRLSLGWLIKIAHKVACLPGAGILVETPPFCFLLLNTLGGLWIFLVTSSHRWWGGLMILAGVGAMYFSHPPDILMAREGQVMAYRLDKTLYVSSSTYGRFFTECWAKEMGISNTQPWLSHDLTNSMITNLVKFSKNGHTLLLATPPKNSFSKGYYKQFKAVAGTYKIILSSAYSPRFLVNYFKGQHTVIDRSALHSTALIWVEKEGVIVKWVADSLGKRPWTCRN